MFEKFILSLPHPAHSYEVQKNAKKQTDAVCFFATPYQPIKLFISSIIPQGLLFVNPQNKHIFPILFVP